MAKYSLHQIPGWVVCSIPAVMLNVLSYHLYGPGISPDSVTYLSAAQSFGAGNNFLGVDGLPLTNWPPLYPILLSMVNGSLLNHLSLILSAFLIWTLMEKTRHRTLLTTLAVCSFPMLKLTSMLWSEPVFIVLLLALLTTLKENNSFRKRNSLLLVAMITASLCLQRYVGIFFAGTLLLMTFRYRQYKLSAAVMLGLLPLAGWFIRNHLIRSNTPYSSIIKWDNGYQNLKGCFEALPLSPVSQSVLAWMLWALIMFHASWLIVAVCRKPFFTRETYLQSAIAVYLVVVINWSALIPIELFRYLLLSYPFIILLLRSYLDRYKWVLWFLIAINTLILFKQTNDRLQKGAGGYSTHRWKQLPIKDFVLSLPDSSYMSNASDLIFLETGKRIPFTSDTTIAYPYIIWIKPVDRFSDLYTAFTRQGYYVVKDNAGIQILTKY